MNGGGRGEGGRIAADSVANSPDPEMIGNRKRRPQQLPRGRSGPFLTFHSPPPSAELNSFPVEREMATLLIVGVVTAPF